MPIWILVALGSALGGVARWALSAVIETRTGPGFPWGTLAVNVLGGLAIGLCAVLVADRESTRWYVLVTGMLGGFTTFSAFSLQSFELLQSQRFGAAAAYIAASVVVCVLACWAGWLLGRSFSAGS